MGRQTSSDLQLSFWHRIPRPFWQGIAAVSFLLSASCGPGAPPEATAPTAPTTEESAASEDAAPSIALVLGGPANDDSWNEAAFDAMKTLESQGVEIAISESIPDADIARVLRQYASQGFDVIIGHSYNHQDAVFQVAEEFPEVNFAWAGAIGRTATNVADYDQPFYEGSYLIGFVAAELSETGKLGALYGFDIPACHAMGEAMLAAAQTVRPEMTLSASAVGDWYDVAKAKEAATAQAETGVDFWIGCGQGPTIGTIEAAKDADGYASGYVGDMSGLGPEVVAVNLIWNMEPIFSQMLEDTASGTFADRFYQLSVAEDVIQVMPTESGQSELSAETLQKIEEIRAQIASGTLEVPFVPQ